MPSEVEASLAVCREHANKDALPGIERAAFNHSTPTNCAGGGARTHTILRSLDFESSASASSATPAQGILKLRSPRRSSSASEHRDSVGVANPHFFLLGVGPQQRADGLAGRTGSKPMFRRDREAANFAAVRKFRE